MLCRSLHAPYLGLKVLLLLAAAPAVADTGAMSVEVVDTVTRRPVENVTVSAESRDGDIQSRMAENGAAIIDNLPVGFFTFRAEAAGYVAAVEPAVTIRLSARCRSRDSAGPLG